ncbi:hypothetical protein [Tistlia consotensis]|nr:hypothetical protein [Tistlia consotensis]
MIRATAGIGGFVGAALLVAASGSPARAASALSGTWAGDDRGTYYLSQTAGLLYWYGESADRVPRPDALEADDTRPAWSQVFAGRIGKACLRGSWADVPKGAASGAGTADLAILADGNVLVVVRATAGFPARRLTRASFADRGPAERRPAIPEEAARAACPPAE